MSATGYVYRTPAPRWGMPRGSDARMISHMQRYPAAMKEFQEANPEAAELLTRPNAQGIGFDMRRAKRNATRKAVDFNSSMVKYVQARRWQRDYRDRPELQPDILYHPNIEPAVAYDDNPMSSVTTRFVRTSTNKVRCPIFDLCWTPEGRRLITAASSGEFTLWNGLTFNFETILQAHEVTIRALAQSHDDQWMISSDQNGYVKYWQTNMNNVRMYQAHREACRGLSFAPSDRKYASCSDDGTVRIWDFTRCDEERVLRGHGADVRCVSWHPQRSLIVSGSKDSQQPIKFWDPKSGKGLSTLHAHKSTVTALKWNPHNHNWLATSSRDHIVKLFDVRSMKSDLYTLKGHKKEVASLAWHPIHEGLLASAGGDGSLLFWLIGLERELASIDNAHESCIWALGWHPLGHILATGSNDHATKFWARNRPGDKMRDKYNLNLLPSSIDQEIEPLEFGALVD